MIETVKDAYSQGSIPDHLYPKGIGVSHRNTLRQAR